MSSAAACSPRALSGRGPMRDRSAQGQDTAQHVGRQVEVVCNAFGYDASFSDFDLGHPGEPDPRRLAPELKFLVRPQLHWALQEESELAPTDCSCTGEPVLHEIEVFVQRPGIETSDERIGEAIARGGRTSRIFSKSVCAQPSMYRSSGEVGFAL